MITKKYLFEKVLDISKENPKHSIIAISGFIAFIAFILIPSLPDGSNMKALFGWGLVAVIMAVVLIAGTNMKRKRISRLCIPAEQLN